MGTQTQQDKAGNKYEVNPQYEELSKQIPPGSNHAAGHFLEAEICFNTANILAKFLIIITINLLPESNPNSTHLRRLRLLKNRAQTTRIAHPKAHASRRTHAQTFLKGFEVQQLRVSTSSANQVLKWVANERAKQGEFSATKISRNKGWIRSLSAAIFPFSYRKIQQQQLNNNRTKMLQNDTVPTYINDAAATTSRQQLSQAKQPRADNSSLYKAIYLLTAVDRQSGPRPETIFLQSAYTRKLMDFSTDGNSSSRWPEQDRQEAARGGRRAARGGREGKRGIQLSVGPQPLRLRNHDFGLAQRIMVKRLATSRHDPLGITDSACKNLLVVVSVQYGPFNTCIPIKSTTIGKSRVARDPIAMHTSWRSNSDIASVTSIGYPRMRASGESSTTKHRLLHASGSHPIPPPNDPKLIHSTNGNHLESPNEGSSIDHQVTIHLHAQNITMFPTNETWYFASQMLVSSSGGLILILMAQSTSNKFTIHSDY
ncbi:carboxyl-terminal-processing peptidase 1, chloroplastic [Dorcoceras hygrometricum]|uniref:Carboxyl-terminal-processing peptidase 1, chloroplastic n=1 Tax=Dorcoceras hygrometricum TaxID=472368 RepID=A0A2Z7AHC3_9LAMI|nr:carboxyl-terminal-processing peptidase 1, chloroplastic [Dorcoceras hygrometricum]